MSTTFAIVRAMIVLSVCGGVSVSAQTVPAGPARAFDGRLVASGEVSATFGAPDHIAYFNYTDYEHNALRTLRLALSAAWRPVERIAFVGEMRCDNFDAVRPFAAYVRVRPWRNRAFDVQAGRIPPAFGAFGRRAYGVDNSLVGYPLAYQYLTSLRSDAVPATADDLLRMRARGWQSSFPVGAQNEAPGVPVVSAFRWDTGVQARWSEGPIELTGAVTNGTLSNPRLSDDNGGKQISGRAAFRPIVGLVVGASASRGAWLSRAVTVSTPERQYTQRAFGADAEYSRDHWVVRGELIWSAWALPWLESGDAAPVVNASAAWIEARYRLTPRWFVAGRADRIDFSAVTGAELFAGEPTPWDAPVSRVEAAAGYYLQRNVIARVAVQRNARDAGRVHRKTYVAGQLTYWF